MPVEHVGHAVISSDVFKRRRREDMQMRRNERWLKKYRDTLVRLDAALSELRRRLALEEKRYGATEGVKGDFREIEKGKAVRERLLATITRLANGEAITCAVLEGHIHMAEDISSKVLPLQGEAKRI